ncbi:MAG: hypothetical protein JWM64_2006 [Frankiales bacterium]|nr:hypothetical protein [Frankiales bacterium]
MRLADGEELVLDVRTHGKALVLPVLALLVVLAVLGYAEARLEPAAARVVAAAVAVLLLVRLSLVPWLRWQCTRFVLTDERISLRRGVLRRTGRDVPLSRVEEVTFSQTLLQRLQGCGSLQVEAGEADSVVVADLPHVEAVQRAVYRQLDGVRR